MTLVVKYALFAMLATATNIGAQEVVVRAFGGRYSLFASAEVGAGIGLTTKDVLDTLFVFNFRANSALHDAGIFLQYAGVGVLTTLIFWIFKFGFNALSADKNIRYLGALIGLALGYYIKYRIDKRLVFRVRSA